MLRVLSHFYVRIKRNVITNKYKFGKIAFNLHLYKSRRLRNDTDKEFTKKI
jgi:hypothetical protein